MSARISESAAAISLLVILGMAGLVRCDRLTLQPLSNDESFSWRLASYSTADLFRHVPGDAHPPLYYLVLKGWIVLFGDSLFAMRSLSIVFALLSIIVLYALCGEAAARFPSTPGLQCAGISGALFGALLLAVHLAPSEEPSRIARMYSQGVFLACLTAWLSLRALRCRCPGWWFAYGLAVAAFCYTHYYAFFSVAAQALFVIGDLAVRRRIGSGASLLGFLLAVAFAFLLYLPWLPVGWKQVHDVWQGFWIPSVTWEHAKEVFFVWSSGLRYQGGTDLMWWALFLLACAVWMLWRGDRGGLFFLTQASLPWVLSLAFSVWSGRPIFYERYLVFAQLFLFGFWGIILDRLSSLVPRLGLAAGLCTMSLFGLWMEREQWPTGPPGLATVAAFLRDHYKLGDLVLIDSPSELNCLRYYSARAGISYIQARCFVTPFQPPGHIVHLGSLQPEDILWNGLSPDLQAAQRVWRLSENNAGMPATKELWREVSRQTFGEESEGQYHLVLYEHS